MLKINFIFEGSNRYLILGKSKSGKTSLIRALLGHMNKLQG